MFFCFFLKEAGEDPCGHATGVDSREAPSTGRGESLSFTIIQAQAGLQLTLPEEILNLLRIY